MPRWIALTLFSIGVLAACGDDGNSRTSVDAVMDAGGGAAGTPSFAGAQVGGSGGTAMQGSGGSTSAGGVSGNAGVTTSGNGGTGASAAGGSSGGEAGASGNGGVGTGGAAGGVAGAGGAAGAAGAAGSSGTGGTSSALCKALQNTPCTAEPPCTYFEGPNNCIDGGCTCSSGQWACWERNRCSTCAPMTTPCGSSCSGSATGCLCMCGGGPNYSGCSCAGGNWQCSSCN